MKKTSKWLLLMRSWVFSWALLLPTLKVPLSVGALSRHTLMHCPNTHTQLQAHTRSFYTHCDSTPPPTPMHTTPPSYSAQSNFLAEPEFICSVLGYVTVLVILKGAVGQEVEQRVTKEFFLWIIIPFQTLCQTTHRMPRWEAWRLWVNRSAL